MIKTYKGFVIIYHHDIGKFAIYSKNATVPNVAQAVQLFNYEESCIKYIKEKAL